MRTSYKQINNKKLLNQIQQNVLTNQIAMKDKYKKYNKKKKMPSITEIRQFNKNKNYNQI